MVRKSRHHKLQFERGGDNRRVTDVAIGTCYQKHTTGPAWALRAVRVNVCEHMGLKRLRCIAQVHIESWAPVNNTLQPLCLLNSRLRVALAR